jgi:hypothetical protein
MSERMARAANPPGPFGLSSAHMAAEGRAVVGFKGRKLGIEQFGPRDDHNIEARLWPVPPKDLPHQTLRAVPLHGAAESPGGDDSETCETQAVRADVEREKTPSAPDAAPAGVLELRASANALRALQSSRHPRRCPPLVADCTAAGAAATLAGRQDDRQQNPAWRPAPIPLTPGSAGSANQTGHVPRRASNGPPSALLRLIRPRDACAPLSDAVSARGARPWSSSGRESHACACDGECSAETYASFHHH